MMGKTLKEKEWQGREEVEQTIISEEQLKEQVLRQLYADKFNDGPQQTISEKKPGPSSGRPKWCQTRCSLR